MKASALSSAAPHLEVLLCGATALDQQGGGHGVGACRAGSGSAGNQKCRNSHQVAQQALRQLETLAREQRDLGLGRLAPLGLHPAPRRQPTAAPGRGFPGSGGPRRPPPRPPAHP